jgi:DNA-binding CsgD family transcriptional regulator/pimeloyl-ACP methyl ester carboxylesterase
MNAPPVQYAKTNDGYDIAYAVSGEGTPLVMCPPVFSHVQLLWSLPRQSKMLAALAERFQLIQLDLRGQGMSTRGLTEVPTAADFERDIGAVVAKLGLSSFVLLGVSAFAHIALRFTADNASQVKALILVNGSAERPTRGMLTLDTASQAEQDWEAFLHFAASMGRPSEDSLLVREIYRKSVDQKDWLKLSEATRAFRASEVAPLPPTPALLLAASSAVNPGVEEASKQIAAMLPNSRLVVMEDVDAGMMSDGDCPPGVELITEFVCGLPEGHSSEGVASPNSESLSAREVEVLRLLAAGKSNQQIADELVISLNTVNRHVSNIYAKTGAANRAEAVGYAHRNGLAG